MKVVHLFLLCFFIVCIYILFYKDDKKNHKKVNSMFMSIEPTQTYYLLTPNPYDISLFVKDLLLSYQSYKKTNTWIDSFQHAMEDTYQLHFNTKILPTSTQTFINSTVTQISQVVKNPNDDVYNWLAMLTVTFVPECPSTYKFYTYQPIAPHSFYMNFSKPGTITLKDMIDIVLPKNDSFYVSSTIIDTLNTSPFIDTITKTTIAINDIRLPVQYTYFDPLDIYKNPSKYTFCGIGIVDSSQPEYVVLVDPSQFSSLNRLLKNSDASDKIPIHPWFSLPDYTVEWNDDWSTMFSASDTNPIQDGINKILVSKQMKPLVDYTTTSLFSLPSTYYWIITLLSLAPTTTPITDLFVYMKHPGISRESCEMGCINPCLQTFDNYAFDCMSWICGDENETKCSAKCLYDAASRKKYYCGTHRDINYPTFQGHINDSVNTCIKKNNCE